MAGAYLYRLLIRDLLQGARISKNAPRNGHYTRIIDATGSKRAFLPPPKADIMFTCVQYRMQSDTPLGNRIQLGRIGNAWCFPLANGEYHVGCGSFRDDPVRILDKAGRLKNHGHSQSGSTRKLCTCQGAIRLSGPHHSQPFFSEQGAEEGTWGIGEAIGCVAPWPATAS